MDCKMRPAIEVDLITEDGICGRGAAPTGTSVGMHETCVLRDNDPGRFDGLSVYKAVSLVNDSIGPEIIGMDVLDQSAFDTRLLDMDGTANLSRLGGNTVYSLSMACARAGANTQRKSLSAYMSTGPIRTLPLPTFNSINGGHSERLPMGFQEFTFSPYGAKTMEEAIEIARVIFMKVGKVIARFNGEDFANMGHAYGWAPPSADPETVMELLHEAVVSCGYEDKVAYAIDCASSSQYDRKTGTYLYNCRRIDRDEMIGRVKELTEKYNFLYVEDVLEENDWEGFSMAVEALPRTFVIGDDLIVTDLQRLKKAHEQRAAEGFVFKPNQIGPVTRALDASRYAREHGMLVVPSTRGGGIVEDIVMELGVAIEAPVVKNSAPRGGERIYSLNCLYRASDDYPNVPLFDYNRIKRF
jgi:Enolase